jgi:hypothetical protein
MSDARISREHAAAIKAMLNQLLIVLVNRLGGSVVIPVAEIDGTGEFLFSFKLDPDRREFTFQVDKK